MPTATELEVFLKFNFNIPSGTSPVTLNGFIGSEFSKTFSKDQPNVSYKNVSYKKRVRD